MPRAFGVKRCFTARPGNVFICFDFSSAEVKILAAICRDPGMLKAIEDGLDFHSFSAANMYGVPYEDFAGAVADSSHRKHKEYKSLRQTAKVLTFSILYGSSAGGISLQLLISKEEAERLVAMYFNAFPGVKAYIEKTHYEALANGFVITPFGHRRQFYGTQQVFRGTAAYNAAFRGAQNYVIQGSTSVLGAIVFAEINRELKKLGGLCTATVHDSLEAEVPLEYLEEAIEIFYYYMNDWPQIRFPWLGLSIGCDGEIGFNWSEMVHVPRGAKQEWLQAELLKLSVEECA